MTDDDINTPSEAEINTKNVPKKSPRRKRDLLAPKKVIEIAVFVDDDLYKKTVSDAGSKADPVEAIQNLVFAYMNSVSILVAFLVFYPKKTGETIKIFPCFRNLWRIYYTTYLVILGFFRGFGGSVA